VDETRVAQLANELDLCEYPEAMGKKAETWILRGAPCRFGTLTLAEIDELCQEMNVPVTTEMIFGGVPETILESAKQF